MLYCCGKDGVLISQSNHFVYEVSVFILKGRTYTLDDSKLFIAQREIKDYVPRFWATKSHVITCDLYAAPLEWLQSNNYQPYEKTK
jgi:hypothetical protein